MKQLPHEGKTVSRRILSVRLRAPRAGIAQPVVDADPQPA
jgi:hypothetical protein